MCDTATRREKTKRKKFCGKKENIKKERKKNYEWSN